MKEENWALPVMQTLILDLRNFARRGDKRCGGKPGERQEKAAETMMSAFRTCVADTRAKTDDTKRWGMLFVVNQLFKVSKFIHLHPFPVPVFISSVPRQCVFWIAYWGNRHFDKIVFRKKKFVKIIAQIILTKSLSPCILTYQC